jgi:hypothetical protein
MQRNGYRESVVRSFLLFLVFLNRIASVST